MIPEKIAIRGDPWRGVLEVSFDGGPFVGYLKPGFPSDSSDLWVRVPQPLEFWL